MIKDVIISVLFFIVTVIALSFDVFKGLVYYIPIIISSFILSYIGNKFSWRKIIIFILLFMLLINLGILNRTINYVKHLSSEMFFSWLTDIFISNLKVAMAILVPAYSVKLLKSNKAKTCQAGTP